MLDESVLFGIDRAVVAVSGGGDSVALLHLLHAHGIDCQAVTVDHRLRANSADDVSFVARICETLGVPHCGVQRGETLNWNHQQAAREGRYDALWAVAKKMDRPIVTGHTLDDQAETLRMRARRGGGTLGLSGIPPIATLQGKTRLLRPLLNTTRQELRDWLSERNIDWLDDPSNERTEFERIRLRKLPMPCRLADLGRFAVASRGHRAAIMRLIADDLAENLGGHAPTFTYRPKLRGIALVHSVRLLTAWVGANAYWPSQARITQFLDDGKGFSIAGSRVRKVRGGFQFSVDPRRMKTMHDASAAVLKKFRPASDDPVWEILSDRDRLHTHMVKAGVSA